MGYQKPLKQKTLNIRILNAQTLKNRKINRKIIRSFSGEKVPSEH